MRMPVCGVLALSAALAAPAIAQNEPASPSRPKFLDVMTVEVRPEKHAEFAALIQKAVDANRRYKGDQWITFGAVYGPGHTYVFSSPRASFDAVEKSYAAFDRALKEGLGPAAEKLGHDFDSCIAHSQSEIRAVRYDLSRNVPDDLQGIQTLVGNTRWVTISHVDVKRSKIADWESAAAEFLDAFGRAGKMMLVSQTVSGGSGDSIQFHVASYYRNMAEMDAVGDYRQRLGDELYRKFQMVNGETVNRIATAIYRPMPKLSNPPETLVNVSRDFWMPKPPMTAARKAKPEAKSPQP